jgi:hypothetical protein
MRRIRMQRVRRTLLVLGVVSALMALSAGIAFADNINDDISDNASGITLIAGDPNSTGTAQVKIVSTNGDGNNQCNIDNPATQSVTLQFNTPSGVTANPGTMKFTQCDVFQGVSFSASASAVSGTVTASIIQNNTMGSYNNNVRIPITVAQPPPPPPPSDSTPPLISYVVGGNLGDNGWYTTNVTLTWTVTENESPSSLVKTGCVDQNITADQAATTYSCSASSDGGAAGPVELSIKRDATKPQNAVSGVSNGATYTVGSVPAAGCQTTDNLSGVAESATPSVSGGTSNGVGSFTAACNGGKDNAGNSADSASVTYNVHYAGLSGILQPINPDNSSLFSRGKAVPVKFKLAGDEPNGFDYSAWKLERIKVSCTNFDTEEATLESVVENPSNAFRYDSAADQYINNASFKDQAAGTCWKVRVSLDSGQTMDSAIFKLQK